ncbi:phospholipase D-like domain-containing protein [Nocardioides coralli]|uniref:phospholipase D-like domain-containing protein n=1 Tax=Nocardioides coralli TaxID=2872154 RepID=UPI001CA4426F|nr:phospholipase D-like domain-containing protein [Nocardioides coralli]QZY30041.1 hypothetical protein K6T13_04980 [Nocardioides coralli]
MQKQLRGLGRGLTPGVAAVALAVTVSLVAIPGADTTRTSTPDGAATVEAADLELAAGKKKKKKYTPGTGVIVTNPLGESKHRIMGHLLRTIDATPRGERIRIITWNLVSKRFIKALIRAHDRGVSVRLLMSKRKAKGQSKQGSFYSLKRNLRDKNKKRSKGMKSWARGCSSSCRGRSGIAHSKFFIFSKAGKARNVVMSTSANATEVSVYRQWNDMFTLANNKRIHDGFADVFKQAAADRPVKRQYRTFEGKSVAAYVYPWRGPGAKGDRVIKELRRISCRGARGGTGINGRTRIRIAQDAIINNRGIEIARVLRHKYQSGCNIKIVFALMGKQVRQILKNTSRGRVPMRQIVQDWDEDGVYDRYLHAKVMAVSGRYGKNRSARIAWQGSENWSQVAEVSDEQGFIIRRSGAEGTYARWVDWLHRNPPPRSPSSTSSSPRATLRIARARGVDPYALIKEELGLTEASSR